MGGCRALARSRGACSGAGGQSYPRAITSHSYGAVSIFVGGGAAHGAVPDHQGRRLSEYGGPEGFCAKGGRGTGHDAGPDGRESAGENNRGTLASSAGSECTAA